YRRSSKEVSFVRTGFGGQKVIMNGGALVFPILHEVIPVNMNTLRLEVRRHAEQALITRDRMRVDVQAEFYVRVQPTVEAIADAAQTLGQRTMRPQDLKELVEGKFVDALRAVAAETEALGATWAELGLNGGDLTALAARGQRTAERAAAVLGELRGQLAIVRGQLVQVGDRVAQPALRQRLSAALSRAEDALARAEGIAATAADLADMLRRGEGTVGRLLTDPEFPEDAKQLGRIIKRQPWRLIGLTRE
ncbi:MAG: SPFH domain-containing protein, partial [Myxococcota bacterium]